MLKEKCTKVFAVASNVICKINFAQCGLLNKKYIFCYIPCNIEYLCITFTVKSKVLIFVNLALYILTNTHNIFWIDQIQLGMYIGISQRQCYTP